MNIDYYEGREINSVYQNPDLQINFSIKMNIISELIRYLKKSPKKWKKTIFKLIKKEKLWKKNFYQSKRKIVFR